MSCLAAPRSTGGSAKTGTSPDNPYPIGYGPAAAPNAPPHKESHLSPPRIVSPSGVARNRGPLLSSVLRVATAPIRRTTVIWSVDANRRSHLDLHEIDAEDHFAIKMLPHRCNPLFLPYALVGEDVGKHEPFHSRSCGDPAHVP